MNNFKIGSKTIGQGAPCFIIAEAGVNHNGDIKLAKKLIDRAAEAGADAVKFQTFKAEALVTENAAKAAYQKETTGADESQFNMLKKLELVEKDYAALFAYAKKRNIMFLSTPFDEGSADMLEKLGVPAFKIGSGEITNLPFLRHVGRKGKPVILSCGMSTLEETVEAVKAVRAGGSTNIAVLHCVSCYPAQPEDTNLRAMAALKAKLRLPIGLSDHSVGIHIPIAAAALGASIIEKHFTLDRNMEGPDHRASLEPNELKEMVRTIREVESAMGDGLKRPTKAEEDTMNVARRSLVAKAKIPAGTVITADMLVAMRPGTGIPPSLIDTVIGKKTTKAIERNGLLVADELK